LSAEIAETIGYRTLLRSTRDFRYLWIGQIVSNLGDWFDLIASTVLDFPFSIFTLVWAMALLPLIPATLWSPYLVFSHEWFALPDTA
jgi:hypothetical protein